MGKKSDNIPMGFMEERCNALVGLLNDRSADAILLTDLKNIRYFSGFTGSSALLLFSSEKSFFLTDGRYKTQAQSEVIGAEVIVFNEMLDSLESVVSDLGASKVAFESRNISYNLWNEISGRLDQVKLVPLRDETKRLRSFKDAGEMEAIRKGVGIAKEAFLSVKDMIRPGVKEMEIALFLELAIRERGAEAVSFDIIVASGKRSALPHAMPGEKEIEAGDLVVVDFGVIVDGYHTDETCTLKVGDVPKEAETIYDIVLEAHDRAIEKAKPGVKVKDVDAAARDYIKVRGYGSCFGHGTGHGVGLDVHELPVVSEKSDDIIEEGMVFTVEPGIYLPELGGVRIEDMVYITSSGAEIITECNNFFRAN